MNNAHQNNNAILLRTAGLTLIIGLILAWCLVFSVPLKLPVFLEIFKDTESLLSAHLDFLMMTMLLLGFYASKLPLPKFVMLAMAIGSIGNPTLFLIGAVAPEYKSLPLMLFTFLSISLTTYGYGMASIKAIRFSLNK